MKNLSLAALFASILIPSAHAQEDSRSFTCLVGKNQSFSLQVGRDAVADPSGAVNIGSATALHGMNVAIASRPVKITVFPIQTRTIVGEQYVLTLPDGVGVELSNITGTTPELEDLIGVFGKATLKDGKKEKVVCQ